MALRGDGLSAAISHAELRFLNWIERHLWWIVLVVVTLAGIGIRISLRSFESQDYQLFLSPWYDEIKSNGGLRGLGVLVGNYNVLYQFCIALLTYLPIHKLYAYKVLSCLFDFLLAWCAGRLASYMRNDSRWVGSPTFLVAFACVLLCPIVFFNSAAWAQCDSIWTSLCLLAILLLMQKKPIACFVVYGLAWSFKLQSIFLLPLFLYVWYKRRDFTALCFLIVPLMMLLTGVPAIVAGVSPLQLFRIYQQQTVEHSMTLSQLVVSYPGLWAIVCPRGDVSVFGADAYQLMKNTSILFTAGCLIVEVYLLSRKGRCEADDYPRIAMLFGATCVCLLPTMHERYGFIVEVLAISCAVANRRFLMVAVPMVLVTLATYGMYLFGYMPNDLRLVAFVNTLCMAGLVYLVLSDGQARENMLKAGSHLRRDC